VLRPVEGARAEAAAELSEQAGREARERGDG
jgi:hypothetical protein